jgi:hypothetical protein
MTWKYKPTPVKNETYWFTGPFYVDTDIIRQFTPDEVSKAFRAVIEASLKQGGLDKIQELEHETTKAVIQIMNVLSEEQKKEIHFKSATPEEDIRSRNGTIALLHKRPFPKISGNFSMN